MARRSAVTAAMRRALYLALPLSRPRWWLAALWLAALAAGASLVLEWRWLDAVFYDRVLAANQRQASPLTQRVVFDADIPLSVSREQSLTLQALAVERLVAMGARSVVLDAQIALRNRRAQDFVACLPTGEPPRLCTLLGEQACQTLAGRKRTAPLDMDAAARRALILPTPLSDRQPPPHAWLLGAADGVRMVQPTLPLGADGLIRHMGTDAGSLLGAFAIPPPDTAGLLALRFGDASRVAPLPLSQLVACETRPWQALSPQVRGRHVVLQLTDEHGVEDVHMVPTGPGGSVALRSGGRLIEDGLATLLQGDGPRLLPWPWLLLLGLLILAGWIAACCYLRACWLGLLALVLGGAAWLLAPLAYPYALLPWTALLIALLVATSVCHAGHLYLRTRQNSVLARFLPPQVRHLLLADTPLAKQGQQVEAVVLMSDLADYASLTRQLPSALAVFDFINDYLTQVTAGMQLEHGAWLESYMGDMVCYYWPDLADGEASCDGVQPLQAAVMLLRRQQAWLNALPQRLPPDMPLAQREQLAARLFAGVALTQGKVCMGEIGPQGGIRKFGIIGDPLNLVARLEALTRHFSARLIVTAEMLPAASHLGLQPRLLAQVQLKGRQGSLAAWALHLQDEAVDLAAVAAWDAWRQDFEAGGEPAPPPLFEQDAATLRRWRQAGWWDTDQACYLLEQK